MQPMIAHVRWSVEYGCHSPGQPVLPVPGYAPGQIPTRRQCCMPINAYRDYLEQQFNRYRVPGAAVLLERDGEPLLHAGFGHADLAQERPVNKATVCEIGRASCRGGRR